MTQLTSIEVEGKSNLSCYLEKPYTIRYADRPFPTIQGPHDVIVAVNYTGICGSDIHFYAHGGIGNLAVEEPLVLGHESAGTIVSVGSAVTSLVVGDRVALEPGYPCRHCESCLGGKYNICPKVVMASCPPYHGTLTGFWRAPDDFCYKLPGHISLAEGALVEPLAVAAHMVQQAGVSPSMSVVVMGAGPVGVLTAWVAKAFGAATIVSVDVVPTKLEQALEWGVATHIWLAQKGKLPADHAAAILASTEIDPAGADIVMDATGVESSIQTAVHAVRRGGTYVQGGMGAPHVSFPIMEMCFKEVRAFGSFRYGPGDYRLAMHLISSRQIDLKKLITGVVDFRHAEDGIKAVQSGKVMKVLILGPNESLEDHDHPGLQI